MEIQVLTKISINKRLSSNAFQFLSFECTRINAGLKAKDVTMILAVSLLQIYTL